MVESVVRIGNSRNPSEICLNWSLNVHPGDYLMLMNAMTTESERDKNDARVENSKEILMLNCLAMEAPIFRAFH